MATKLGKDATLCRNTATFGSPTYNSIDNVRNLSYDATRAEADTTTRGSDIATVATSRKSLTISFELLYDSGDADFAILETAFNTNIVVELAVFDGPFATSGSKGWHGDWYVTKFARKEDLEGVVMYDVEVKPAKTANVMVWVTIGS